MIFRGNASNTSEPIDGFYFLALMRMHEMSGT